jgi:hypothetical protein
LSIVDDIRTRLRKRPRAPLRSAIPLQKPHYSERTSLGSERKSRALLKAAPYSPPLPLRLSQPPSLNSSTNSGALEDVTADPLGGNGAQLSLCQTNYDSQLLTPRSYPQTRRPKFHCELLRTKSRNLPGHCGHPSPTRCPQFPSPSEHSSAAYPQGFGAPPGRLASPPCVQLSPPLDDLDTITPRDPIPTLGGSDKAVQWDCPFLDPVTPARSRHQRGPLSQAASNFTGDASTRCLPGFFELMPTKRGAQFKEYAPLLHSPSVGSTAHSQTHNTGYWYLPNSTTPPGSLLSDLVRRWHNDGSDSYLTTRLDPS